MVSVLIRTLRAPIHQPLPPAVSRITAQPQGDELGCVAAEVVGEFDTKSVHTITAFVLRLPALSAA